MMRRVRMMINRNRQSVNQSITGAPAGSILQFDSMSVAGGSFKLGSSISFPYL